MALPKEETQSYVTLTSDGSAVAGSWSDVLREIDSPAVALACWSRRMTEAAAGAFDGWPADGMPNLSLFATSANIAAQVRDALAACTRAPPLARDILAADLPMIGQLFGRITGLSRFEVRIEAVNDNACEKFHRDNVTARLLVTYRGPGTQWVPQGHAEEALRDQQAYHGPLYELPRFAVALAKGSARGGCGLVHRSPPIEGKGVTRLFVAMNAPFHVHDDDCDCHARGGGLRYRR